MSAVIVTAILSLSACTGGFSATATCEAAGGEWVGGACSHRWTQEELAAKQWCETSGGAYLVLQNHCAFGMGGP